MADRTTPVENENDITTATERICRNLGNAFTQGNYQTVFQSRVGAFRSAQGTEWEMQFLNESVGTSDMIE